FDDALSLAYSSLLPHRLPKSFVLVGGPGAGKSTYAKNMIIQHLTFGLVKLPFFVRLREFNRGSSIKDMLVQKLTEVQMPDPLEVIDAELRRPTLCILDGLDEVRADLQADAYEAINQFYSTFFQSSSRGTLVITCRKEAYRSIPLELPSVMEVLPLDDRKVSAFARNWPPGYPAGKSADTFLNDLTASPRVLEVSRSPLLLVGS